MSGQLRIVAVIAALCAALAGCTSAGLEPSPTGSPTVTAPTESTPLSQDTSPTRSTTSSPTVPDLRSAPAVAAYKKFMAAVVAAEMHPSRLGAQGPPNADFARWSFDPLQEKVAVYLAGLSEQGAAFRGAPPRVRLRVVKLDLSASPEPTVILSNCPTPAPAWHEYLTATGKTVPFTTPNVTPPYRVRVKMIKVHGRWGASIATPDTTTTCTG